MTCALFSPTQNLHVRGAGVSTATAEVMLRRLVTCPETAHLEEIHYLDSPLGILISACSRLDEDETCTRECAARMDRRDHPTIDNKRRSGSLLVVTSCLRCDQRSAHGGATTGEYLLASD